MSAFADLVARSQAHFESALGVEVRVDGVGTVFAGVLDRSTHREDLGDGGFVPEASATLTLTKPQLVGLWIPALGRQVTVGGRVYKIIMVEEDDAGWNLGLMATSQQKRGG